MAEATAADGEPGLEMGSDIRQSGACRLSHHHLPPVETSLGVGLGGIQPTTPGSCKLSSRRLTPAAGRSQDQDDLRFDGECVTFHGTFPFQAPEVERFLLGLFLTIITFCVSS